MTIRVEFYGLARQRAGVSQIELPLLVSKVQFRDVLLQLAERLPDFARQMIVEGRLHSVLSANLDGQQFVSEPTTPIADGQSLLILSADAGG